MVGVRRIVVLFDSQGRRLTGERAAGLRTKRGGQFRCSSVILLLAISVFSAGCTSRATLRVPRSAEAPVRLRQSLVVLPVEGGPAPAATAHLQLFQELAQADYYQLVSPQQLQAARGVPLFPEGQTAGQVDRHAAVDSARRMQLDLLLASRLHVAQPNAVHVGQSLVQFGSETLLETQLEYELIDVRSGRVVFRDVQSNSFRGELRHVDGRQNSHDRVLDRLVADSAAAASRKLVPHHDSLTVPLKRAWWGRSGAHVRKGITAAKSGNWQAAEQQWKKTLELEPNHAVAHYNLGVAQEAQGRFAEAEQHYQQALRFAGSMDPQPMKTARQRVRGHQREMQRISYQTAHHR